MGRSTAVAEDSFLKKTKKQLNDVQQSRTLKESYLNQLLFISAAVKT